MPDDIRISAFGLAKGEELLSDDSYSVRTFGEITVGIIADGVGDAKYGAKASKRVVDYMINNFKNRPKTWSISKSLKHFISNINNILYKESIEQHEKPELLTTLAVAVIYNNRLYGANVGDSRIYLRREGKLQQLSIDHSDSEHDHILTQAIGADIDVNPHFFENDLSQGDKLLICSDGLYNIFDDDALSEKISSSHANMLVKQASKALNDDLKDDVSAVVIDILKMSAIALLKQQKLSIPKKLEQNDMIDGIKLIEPLDESCRTWKAVENSESVVIKFPAIEAANDEWMLDLFVKEAWNASRLKAGFFPKAWIPQNRSCHYYILEYIEGDDLGVYIHKNKKLSIDDTVNLAKFLLKASIYLSEFDLGHGDIKPENIIVAKRKDKMVFKLIDFGLIMEFFSSQTKTGTPTYLAPERFGGGTINEKTEIFSIGTTLYMALTGEFPYGEIDTFETPAFYPPARPKNHNNNIPDWLEHIIMHAICVDDALRYTLYSEMLFEVENSEKVKPFFPKTASLIDKNPLNFYKYGFFLMLVINIYLLLLFSQK